MLFNKFLLLFISIFLVSISQLFFKYISEFIHLESYRNIKFYSIFVLTFIISCLSTILYIFALRTSDLNKTYPFMALTFVITPILNAIVYDNKLSLIYFIGIIFIIIGIYFTIYE